MSVIRRLAWISSGRAYRAFESATRQPEAAFEQTWAATRRVLNNAPYWRGKLRDDLKDNPLTSYVDYKATLDADFAQNHSSLSGERTLFWALSSGTTGQRKLFPLSEIYRRQFQKTNLPLVHALLKRFPGFLNDPVLYFTGLHPVERSPAGIDVGYISNYNYRHVPWLLRKAYAFPTAVLRDAETFSRYGAVYALSRDLSAMFAIAPMRLTLFCESVWERRRELLELLSGSRALPSGLPPPQVSKQRLALLERAFAGDRLLLRDLWPSLQFLCCWKSGGCAPQLQTLAPYALGVPIVDANYSATEGWVNVPLGDPNERGGPIHPGAVLAEFLPVGETNPKHIRRAWELDVGADYEVLMTNLMGLVRYQLADVVRCTGKFHRSAVIEFVQKSGAELVLGMIRVSEEQMLQALGTVPQPLGRWLFGPSAAGDRLVLYVDTPPSSELGERLHTAITLTNPYYARDTKGGVLKPLSIVQLPSTHAAWARVEHAQSKPRTFVHEAPT